MSDLQCPARFFVGAPAGGDDVQRWRAALRPEGLVAEYDLRGRQVGVSDLVDLSDVHRGEAVLVVVDEFVPALAGAAVGELVAAEVDSTGLLRRGLVPSVD